MSGPRSLLRAIARPGLGAADAVGLGRPLVRGSVVIVTLRLGTKPAFEQSRSYIPSTCFRPSPQMHAMQGLCRSPLQGIRDVMHQQQRRLVNTNGISRSLLATREATANRNPNNATAQNAFYQLLLRANLPKIVVERYESGLYASNDAADAAYFRALDMAKKVGSGSAATATHVQDSDGGGAILQSAAQAVAARSKGSNAATSTTTTSDPANGSQRITVVVEESWGTVVWRWVRTVFSILLTTYVAIVLVTLFVGFFESFNDMYKRSGVKNRTNEVRPETQTTRFTDVHGCDEAKEELQEAVEFLRDPTGFSSLGGKLPKGVLLVGPPGTGKTLLARAVAGEAGVPFFYMSGSEFDEVWVGLGAKRVRDLFAAAKAKSPSIIFIDELDAVGSKRQEGDRAYLKQTLNQLLTEMDGFEPNMGVIVIAATNHPEVLDKALTRPGRFDRHVIVGLPDARGRLAILKHHGKNIKLGKDVKLEAIAARTSGLAGADLENILNQAAVHASKAKAKFVGTEHMEWAADKVMMGAERQLVATPREKLMTAYHEAGHALVLYFAEKPPINLHKVTILARGQSLGHTALIPEMDKHSYTLSDYMTMMRVSLGGKVAEELAFGTDNVTSGVSSDLKKATNVAFQVAGLWGMSQKLGPVAYLQEYKDLSSETKAMVEMEVQRILNRAQDEAMKLLTERRKELDLLAQALIRYETLDKEEVQKVIRGESLPNRIALPPDAPMMLALPENTGIPPITGPSGPDPPPPAPPPVPPVPPAPSATS